MKKEDLTGQKFGRLTVLSEGSPYYYKNTRRITWKCQCECGNITEVLAGRLKSGNTKSCGCLNKDILHNKIEDLSGQTFGKLKVIGIGDCSPSGKIRWRCMCECGNTIDIIACNLKSGKTKSCGCYKKEVLLGRLVTHGESHSSRLYKVWLGMKERCLNHNHILYDLYGGRGITVCKEWNDSYEVFKEWAMANSYNPDAPRGECTLDRIDVNKGYSPSNCRWVSMKLQSNNRRNKAS